MSTKGESPPPTSEETKEKSAEPAKTGSGDDAAKVERKASTGAKPPAPPKDAVPQDMMVKHPLQNKWVLWYCKAERNKDWEDCLKQVTCFEYVEDFWALYNHIQLASGLSWGSDYYLFKEGIKPMWEDVRNVKGGRWLIQVEKAKRNEVLDHYWLELLMSVVGEQYDDWGEQICGCVVNVRQKGDKVSLWTRDSTEQEAIMRVGQILKTKLSLQDQISYEAHKDVAHKQSSRVQSRFRV